jgi:HKD family nuclease
MKISFTDNIAESLLKVLKPELSKAKELRFGVAFARESGFSLIKDNIHECLENGGKVDFLLGLDFRTTEPKVLRTLNELKNKGLNVRAFCFSDPSIHDAPIYHPKIYIVSGKDSIFISIGSSNLTAGGLKDNIEINAIIRANPKEEIVSDIYGIYNRLKFQKGRFEPDLIYIEEYEKTYKIIQKKSIAALKERQIKRKLNELERIEKTLPKPQPTRNELFGWQRLVYEKIPVGIFKTSDMYVYEKEFQDFYPENKYIKAKIRQILQQLRDLRLIKHISENRWQRIKERNNVQRETDYGKY